MKFYRENNKIVDYWNKTKANKLTAIYLDYFATRFYKNGERHNIKNVAYINNEYKEFYLNGILYGYAKDFTKESWRRFVKMQVFK